MKEYALTVFAICALCALLSRISFGGGEDVSKIALSVITLYVVISPIASGIKSIDADDLLPPEWSYDLPSDEGYIKVAEDAFANGIAKAIEDKFLLKRGSVTVRVFDFDFESMTAGKIRIILSDSSVTADHRAILAYAEGMGIGECEVKIEIG